MTKENKPERYYRCDKITYYKIKFLKKFLYVNMQLAGEFIRWYKSNNLEWRKKHRLPVLCLEYFNTELISRALSSPYAEYAIKAATVPRLLNTEIEQKILMYAKFYGKSTEHQCTYMPDIIYNHIDALYKRVREWLEKEPYILQKHMKCKMERILKNNKV